MSPLRKGIMNLNKTDQSFETHKPGYYKFEEEESEPRICVKEGCYKKYRTRLNLLRFCSWGCKEGFLSSFGMGSVKGVRK